MFVKRAKPGTARGAANLRQSAASGSEGENDMGTSFSGGQRRKLVSIGAEEDEDEAPTFKVKKTKMSREMAATKAPANVSFASGIGRTAQPGADRGGRMRQTASGSRVPGAVGGYGSEVTNLVESGDEATEVPCPEAGGIAGMEDVLVSEPLPGFDDDDEAGESKAGMAARLARAQRASARELGVNFAGGGGGAPPSVAEYIPLSSQAPKLHSAPDKDSDAGRLSVKALAAAAQRELNEGEDDVDVGEEWALQQMRVGTHRRYGGTPQAAMPELDFDASVSSSGKQRRTTEDRDGTSQIRAAADRVAKGLHGNEAQKEKLFGNALLSPSEGMARMWEALKSLEGGAGDRTVRTAELKSQREDAQVQLEEIEKQDKKMSRALRSVQELEELAWSLGGLLDAKVPKLKQAAQTLGQIEEDFVRKRERRRSRNMADALRKDGATLALPQPDDGEDEALPENPGAEELRLQRRRKRREQRARKDLEAEGWETSSVSDADGQEECAKDRSAFCAAAHKQIVADVAERFSSSSSVLRPLRAAKEKLQGEYKQAFVPEALPEVLGMYVEHSLLWWDPLRLCCPQSLESGSDHVPTWGPKKAVCGTQLEGFDWFEDLASYTELMGDDDPDGELVPKLVQQSIFPEVARRLRHCWDVTSLRQSERVASMLDECLLFEVDQSAAGFAGLLESALLRLQKGLEEYAPEVFVPNEALSKWYASSARKRLLWRSCKIARCALQLEGRLPDEQLAQLVLSKVFASRIAPHLRGPRLDPEELAIVDRFITALPQRWLERGLPPMLVPLRDALGPRAPAGPEAAASRAAAAKVLQRMQCFDEAQAILDA